MIWILVEFEVVRSDCFLVETFVWDFCLFSEEFASCFDECVSVVCSIVCDDCEFVEIVFVIHIEVGEGVWHHERDCVCLPFSSRIVLVFVESDIFECVHSESLRVLSVGLFCLLDFVEELFFGMLKSELI